MLHFPIKQSVPLWSWLWPCLSSHLTGLPIGCLAVIAPGSIQAVHQGRLRKYSSHQTDFTCENRRGEAWETTDCLLCPRRPQFREYRWVQHLSHRTCHFPPICPPVFRKKRIFFLAQCYLTGPQANHFLCCSFGYGISLTLCPPVADEIKQYPRGWG